MKSCCDAGFRFRHSGGGASELWGLELSHGAKRIFLMRPTMHSHERPMIGFRVWPVL